MLCPTELQAHKFISTTSQGYYVFCQKNGNQMRYSLHTVEAGGGVELQDSLA